MTDLERAILHLETQYPVYGVEKDQAIRELGLTAAAYYQTLNALIDTRKALEHSPTLVGRLQRIRDTRQQGKERINRG